MSAALALAPSSNPRRRPTQRDELARLARHDHVFGRHSALTRLAQAFARLLSDWAENGQVTAYAWQICEGLGRSGGKLRYSRRSWFRARLELLNNGCITEQLPERLPDGKYGAPPTFTLHFGPGARPLPVLSSRRLRAVVDQAKSVQESVVSDFHRVPGRHGSGSLDPLSSQEITESPSHHTPAPPTAPSPHPTPPPGTQAPMGTGETIGTPSPMATADPTAPPLTPPLQGGEENAPRTVLHAACRIVMQAPDSPRRERLRSPRRVRGELQRLAQALLARGAPLELMIHAARQYAAEDGPWCYWRNLAPGITQICDDIAAWSPPLPQSPHNGRRGGNGTLAHALRAVAATSSTPARPTPLPTTPPPSTPTPSLPENPPVRSASSSEVLVPAPSGPPVQQPETPRTAQQWAARLCPPQPAAPEPPSRRGQDLPDWLRAFRDAKPIVPKRHDH